MNKFIFHVVTDDTRRFIGHLKALDGREAKNIIKEWCREQGHNWRYIDIFGVMSGDFQATEMQ